MGEIVGLPVRKPEQIVWVCACGCRTFELHADGTAMCANCERVASPGSDWYRELPPPVAEPREVDPDARAVVAMNSSDSALGRIVRKMNEDTTSVVIVIHDDGALNTWSRGIDTPEQLDWLDRRLAAARKLVDLTPHHGNGDEDETE